MLAKYSSVIQNYVITVFCNESTLFTTKTRLSNDFSQHYWQESFNGDSFVSQSRFDAYDSLPSLFLPDWVRELSLINCIITNFSIVVLNGYRATLEKRMGNGRHFKNIGGGTLESC